MGECLRALKIHNDGLVDLLQKTNIAIPPFAEPNLLDKINKACDPKKTKEINKCHNSNPTKICKSEMIEPEVVNTPNANAKNDIPLKLSEALVEHTAIEIPALAIADIPGIAYSSILLSIRIN